MDAAVEAFEEIWKEYSKEEVVRELLKNGIEHYMSSLEDSDKEKVTEIMESEGYTGKIWDME